MAILNTPSTKYPSRSDFIDDIENIVNNLDIRWIGVNRNYYKFNFRSTDIILNSISYDDDEVKITINNVAIEFLMGGWVYCVFADPKIKPMDKVIMSYSDILSVLISKIEDHVEMPFFEFIPDLELKHV